MYLRRQRNRDGARAGGWGWCPGGRAGAARDRVLRLVDAIFHAKEPRLDLRRRRWPQDRAQLVGEPGAEHAVELGRQHGDQEQECHEAHEQLAPARVRHPARSACTGAATKADRQRACYCGCGGLAQPAQRRGRKRQRHLQHRRRRGRAPPVVLARALAGKRARGQRVLQPPNIPFGSVVRGVGIPARGILSLRRVRRCLLSRNGHQRLSTQCQLMRLIGVHAHHDRPPSPGHPDTLTIFVRRALTTA